MEQSNQGSVTKTLAQGAAANREVIIEKINEIFCNLWIKIAAGILPAHRRRMAGVEDAYQETLRELDRELQKPSCRFKNRDDIRRWGARVVQCNALDILYDNSKMEGPSVLAGTVDNQDETNFLTVLEERASQQTSCDPPPEIQLREKELENRFGRLNALVAERLSAVEAQDKAILERWLDGWTYVEIVAELGCTPRDIRNTTFDFKMHPTLDVEVQEIRAELKECELEWPGIATRVCLQGKAARLLIDFREES